jgi:uncharacterized membrane protein YoaK (UPF0700 family)
MGAVRREQPETGRRAGRFVWALLLLGIAGAVDAVGFLHLAGLFVSFMSGNTTQVAVALAEGDARGAAMIAAIIAAFVLGVVAGDLIAGEPPRRAGYVLLLEAIVLVLAWRFPVGAGPLLAGAMGMHNALVLRAERVGVALTYVTGTLVHLGRSVAARLARREHHDAGWPYALMWSALLLGGIGGTAGYRMAGHEMMLALAAIIALAGIGRVWWQS